MPDEKDDDKPKLEVELDVPLISVALRRIIDEIRNDDNGTTPRSYYDRSYNRHNRS